MTPSKHKDNEEERLTAELAEAQLRLATLRAELAAFQNQYIICLGPLHFELDEIKARIAALKAEHAPFDIKYQKAAKEAAQRAKASARELRTAVPGRQQFRPSEDLKKAYRKAALQMHPDLASDEHDHQRRHQAWPALHDAYQRGDVDEINRVLEQFLKGEMQVINQHDVIPVPMADRIERLRAMIMKANDEIEYLLASDVAKLKAIVEDKVLHGEDYLASLAKDLRRQIKEARSLLETLI